MLAHVAKHFNYILNVQKCMKKSVFTFGFAKFIGNVSTSTFPEPTTAE